MKSIHAQVLAVACYAVGGAATIAANPVQAANPPRQNLYFADAEVSEPPTEQQSDALHRKLLDTCPSGYVVISQLSVPSEKGQSILLSYGCFDGFGAVQDVVTADHPVPVDGTGGMLGGVKLGRAGGRFAMKIEPRAGAMCVPRRVYAQRRYEINDLELIGYWHPGSYEAKLLRESIKNVDGEPHPCWSEVSRHGGTIQIVHPIAGSKRAADGQVQLVDLPASLATDLDLLASPRFDVHVGPDGEDAWDSVRVEFVSAAGWSQAWIDASLAQSPRPRYIVVGDMLEALKRTPPEYRADVIERGAIGIAEDIRAVLYDLQTLARRKLPIDSQAAARLVAGIKSLPASKFASAASVAQSIIDIATAQNSAPAGQ